MHGINARTIYKNKPTENSPVFMPLNTNSFADPKTTYVYVLDGHKS